MSSEGVTVSVAMCTCDGMQFLGRQLETILGQTVLPDELVIFDDRSTDGTFQFLQRFASSSPVPVVVHQQSARLGIPANFSCAIAAASGDVILLSDQDDGWRVDRIATSLDTIVRTGAAGVFSDAEIIDEHDRPTGHRLWDQLKFTTAERRRGHDGDMLPTLLRHNVVTGATLAFLSSWRPLLLPIDTNGLHDVWISTLLASVASIVAIDEPLVWYRQHGSNEVGVRPRSPLTRLVRRPQAVARYGDEVAQYVALAERLGSWPEGSPEPVALVQAKIDHLTARAAIGSDEHRWKAVGRELVRGRYREFSRGWESALYDLTLRR